MTAWRRWQDYATMVFGVLLFISPIVFGQTSHQVASVSAYVLGVLLFVSGIVAAATRGPRSSVLVNAPGAVALITFLAPRRPGVSPGDPLDGAGPGRGDSGFRHGWGARPG